MADVTRQSKSVPGYARRMEGPLPDEVTAGIRARDPDAFATCYEALANPLFRYLLGQCGDRTLAEDLVEATFLELVEAAPRLVGGAGAVRAWLYRAGRNNLLDARRKERRRGDLPLDERVAAGRADANPGPEELALASAQADVVRAALTRLSDDQREVLLLRFASDLTGPEVARLTGRTVSAVKALQHRGLAALARALPRDAADERSGS
ncbi:MAG TPA: sigma-70 family RNA polymerase sigma factor [Egibacteraceae bacterium]|nr:sigma-70 family RNA polymerase sigma factor [Egibacteraceae bacterium]